ncbi:MAG: putative sulfate exporter family transporter [Nitriliruptor sp.]|nr:MAG: putative sulfate exporter family transporter [Nitriliruptor sp.]
MVLVALLAGMVIANARPLPATLRPGVDLAATKILRVGVALLGARLTLADVAGIGGPSLLVVVVTMATAFATVAVVGRMAGISPELGILLGTGTAVCGNSAIVAASPIVDADEREVSYAVATITIFGTIALLLFPIIGRAVGLSDEEFGVWAGLAINDTSQVVAAGAAYSEQALEHATVVKLVRNALMGPILIGLTIWTGRRRLATGDVPAGAPTYAGSAPSEAAAPTPLVHLWRTARSAVPAFVVAFIVLAAMRSAGLIREEVADVLGSLSAVAITVAIAGVGLRTRIAELAIVGLQPVLVGLAASTALAIVALPLARFILG